MNRLKRAKYLLILLSAALASCASTPIHLPIGVPPGPHLQDITPETWGDLGRLQQAYSDESLEWETWYDKVVGRIKDHDESL